MTAPWLPTKVNGRSIGSEIAKPFGALGRASGCQPAWTYEGFKTAWQREMNLEKLARFREERIVFHGTRKNAVNNLLEVGCSEERVAAIVKMSPAMVHHYSKKVSQFQLARTAMKQFEAGWAELRPHVLGTLKIVS